MKKLLTIIPLVFLLCFTFACQDREAMAELEKFKAQVAVEEQNIAIVKRLFEEMNKGDDEIFRELLASEYASYSPSNSPKPMSREETQELIKMVFKAFPDINWDIQDIIAKGDMVIVRNIIKGTHKGDWQGVPATGIGVEISEIAIVRIQDGKIVEEWL